MSQFPFRLLVLVIVSALLSGSCGDNTSTTSPTSTDVIRSTETFGATLAVGSSQFYSFTTLTQGTTDVTLVSIRPAGNATTTLNSVMGIGIGIPQGTDCALGSATTTSPGLKTQLSMSTNISVYCVKIADVGNLTSSVDYTIRVVHP